MSDVTLDAGPQNMTALMRGNLIRRQRSKLMYALGCGEVPLAVALMAPEAQTMLAHDLVGRLPFTPRQQERRSEREPRYPARSPWFARRLLAEIPVSERTTVGQLTSRQVSVLLGLWSQRQAGQVLAGD